MSTSKITLLPEHPTDASPAPPLPPWKRATTTTDSDIFTRISTFLPQLQAANAQLEADITTGEICGKRIEDVADDEEQYIEMNLGLGVLEEKRPSKSRKRRRREESTTMDEGMQVGGASDAGSNTADSDGEGGDEDGSGSDGANSSSEGEEEEENDDESADDDFDEEDSEEEEEEDGEDDDDEDARVDALLSALGADVPQLGKRKRAYDGHKLAQRDILAALLNIDAQGMAGEKPGIEVVEDRE